MMKSLTLAGAALTCLCLGQAHAAPVAISEQLNTTTNSTDSLVSDGGYDAFDGAFSLTGLNSLTVNRRIDTLNSIQSYRVLETFTNQTASSISTTVQSYTNLGSDSGTLVADQTSFRSITHDGVSSDPVIAFTYGNNAFASGALTGGVGAGEFNLAAALTIAPGQSISILYFATLIRDDTNRSGDIALATSRSNALIALPDLSGLSGREIASIANFSVSATPLPGALPLFASGLAGVGVAAWRRRQKKATA
jgi:hypothetical protein